MTYNGWTNRETWLVNLHMSDRLDDLREQADNREEFESLVDGEIDAEFEEAEDIMYGDNSITTMSNFMRDMMPDMSSLRREINVSELVDSWTDGGDWCDECGTFFVFAEHKGKLVSHIGIDNEVEHIYTCGDCVNEEEWL